MSIYILYVVKIVRKVYHDTKRAWSIDFYSLQSITCQYNTILKHSVSIKSPANRRFKQKCVQAKNRNVFKGPHYWPFVTWNHRYLIDALHTGPVMKKAVLCHYIITAHVDRIVPAWFPGDVAVSYWCHWFWSSFGAIILVLTPTTLGGCLNYICKAIAYFKWASFTTGYWK